MATSLSLWAEGAMVPSALCPCRGGFGTRLTPRQRRDGAGQPIAIGAEEGELATDRQFDAELALVGGCLGIDGDLAIETGEALAEIIEPLGGREVIEEDQADRAGEDQAIPRPG